MSETTREKNWQITAGKMAAIANWALCELLERVEVESSVHDEANEKLNEVMPYLDFDEEPQ